MWDGTSQKNVSQINRTKNLLSIICVTQSLANKNIIFSITKHFKFPLNFKKFGIQMVSVQIPTILYIFPDIVEIGFLNTKQLKYWKDVWGRSDFGSQLYMVEFILAL